MAPPLIPSPSPPLSPPLFLFSFLLSFSPSLLLSFSPSLLLSFSPFRGFLVGMSQLLVSLGILSSYLVNFLLALFLEESNPNLCWKLMLGVSIVPAVIQLVGLFFILIFLFFWNLFLFVLFFFHLLIYFSFPFKIPFSNSPPLLSPSLSHNQTHRYWHF